MNKMIAPAVATLAVAATAFVGPAANAAPYPGSIPTTCSFRSNGTPAQDGSEKSYVLRGQNSYVFGKVTSTDGNYRIRGGVLSVTLVGNTGDAAGGREYSTNGSAKFGPYKLAVGTYSVTGQYTPTNGSVFQSCSDSYTLVVTKSQTKARNG